jgi:peptide/nickel transport system substrate-binding protein
MSVSRHYRWPLLGGLVLVIVALSALSYSTRGGSGPQVPVSGGHYVEAIVGTPLRVNPLYTAFNDADKDLAALVFSGLTRLGPDGAILPDLADSWEVSPDARVYTFHLRQNVAWHDGAAFSADDVIFTWGALTDPNFRGEPSLGEFWQQVECAKQDDLTVVCELPEPFAPFLAHTTIGILPKHCLEGLSAEGLFIGPFNEQPVGTGPFILRDLNSEGAHLESNPSYHWGQPPIGVIELRFFPDYSSAAAAFHGAQAQGLFVGPEASPDLLGQLQEDADLQRLASRRNSYTLLYLNTRMPPLDEKSVRQALIYALDRESIVAERLDGRAQLADNPIVPGTWAYSDNVRIYRYDPEKARSLLERGGWQANSRGVLERDGQELSLALLTDNDPERMAIGQEIADLLKAIGVDASLESRAGSDLVRNFLLPRQFQAVIYGWDQDYDPDPYPAWHSSQVNERGFNLSGYAHGYVDRILSEARQTSDLKRRKALYGEFQHIFAEEVPSILLFYPVYNYFMDKDVKGVNLGVLFEPASRFANVHQWYSEAKGIGP